MTNARDLFIFFKKGCWFSKKNPSELCDGVQHWKHYYPESERSSSNQNQTHQNSGKKMPQIAVVGEGTVSQRTVQNEEQHNTLYEGQYPSFRKEMY